MTDDPRLDRDLDDEIRHHIAESADMLVARGWDADAARKEAERRFGDRMAVRSEMEDVHREDVVRMTMIGWIRLVGADLRYALRALKGRPTYSLAVISTLALGIAASAAVFAVLDSVLLRPVAYADAGRWVGVHQARENGSYFQGMRGERVRAWQETGGELFEEWVAYASQTIVRVDGPQAEGLSVIGVTPNTSTLLGIPMHLGRGILPEDARPGAPVVAVLTRSYWERVGADPELVGQTIRLETGPATVVGVVDDGVRFPLIGRARDMWIPFRSDFSMADRQGTGVQDLWARLPAGLTVAEAQARADVLAEGLAEADPTDAFWGLHLELVDDHRANPDVARAIWLLSATVATILIIALLNGLNLTLVRATSRQREMAIRSAIGGSRYAVLRQLLSEGLVMGVLAGSVAAGVAWLSVELMRDMLPSSLIFLSPHHVEVERRTLTMVFSASVATGLLLGLIPALGRTRRGTPLGALIGRSSSDAPAARRTHATLVITQVALSTTLLAIAGLLTNSLTRLLAVDEGFDYERIVTAALSLSPTRYPDPETRFAFVSELEARLEREGSIESVAISTGSGFSFDAILEAEDVPHREDQPTLFPYSSVGEDYLSTLGMPLLAGRALRSDDAGLDNAVVDRDLAEFLWGSADPVGRRFRIDSHETWLTVVGVVQELILLGRDERIGPYQFLTAHRADRTGSYVDLTMRARTDPASLAPTFRQALRELDPEQSIWKLQSGAEMLADEEDTPRFLVAVMGLLAFVAVSLSAIGLYGVLAYSVGRRKRELGIKIALGADKRRLRTGVLWDGLAMTTLGIVLGIAGSLLAASAVEALLYEVGGRDPMTLISTALLLLAVAGLAAYLPARHATEVDPLQVLAVD